MFHTGILGRKQREYQVYGLPVHGVEIQWPVKAQEHAYDRF